MGIGKFGRALLQGQLYPKELDEKVLKMREVAKNLREEAKLCLHESLRLIKDGSCFIAGAFMVLEGLLMRGYYTVGSLLQDGRMQNMESLNYEILRNSLNANYTAQMQVRMLTEVYNGVYRLLQSSANYDRDTGEANIPQIESDARRRFAQRKGWEYSAPPHPTK